MATYSKPTPLKLALWIAKNGKELAKLIELREFAATERTRVDAYILPVLKEFQFKSMDTGSVIESAEDLYLTEDEDGVAKFFKRAQELHAEHGWTGDPECNPASVASYAVITQEQEVVLPLIAPFMGVTMQQLRNSHANAVKLLNLFIKFYQDAK